MHEQFRKEDCIIVVVTTTPLTNITFVFITELFIIGLKTKGVSLIGGMVNNACQISVMDEPYTVY